MRKTVLDLGATSEDPNDLRWITNHRRRKKKDWEEN